MRRRDPWALAWWALAIAAGLVGGALYHLPELASRLDLVFGDRGDARFITFVCEHWYQSLTGRGRLASPPMFHPVEGTLGYSDALLGYALPYSLLRALGLDMFSALQAVVIVFNFLAYLACFVLLHRVLRLHAFASCAAALFFAWSSPKFAQLLHLQLQFTVLLPLLVAGVVLFARRAAPTPVSAAPARPASARRARSWVPLAMAALAFDVLLLTTYYYAWFFALWSALFLATTLVFATTRRQVAALLPGAWPAIAASAGVLLAGAVPFLLLYLPVTRVTDSYPYEHVLPMIPSPRDFLEMGPGNRVWAAFSIAVRRSPPPDYFGELRVGIGLVPSLAWIGLTLFGIRAAIRRRGQPAELFLVSTILATSLVFALGLRYGDGASPWRWVHAVVPGAGGVRAVARYVLFLSLPMAVAFAFTIDRAIAWVRARARGVAAMGACLAIGSVALFGVYEQFGVRLGFSKTAESAYLSELASRLARDCDTFYLAEPDDRPRSVAELQYDAMLVALLAEIPTVNGLSSRVPSGWDLSRIDQPGYDQKVAQWIAANRIDGKICRLRIETPIEAFPTGSTNPIDQPRFFVRQHYRDLMDREPTAAELERWAGTLESCPYGTTACDRVEVSQRIFRSSEFHRHADFVFRLYLAALDRSPRYGEFMAALARLRALVAARGEEAARLELARELATRAGAPPGGGEASDGRAWLERMVARPPSPELQARALVTMHYFVHLRRDPGRGLEARLTRFNRAGDTRELAGSFLGSTEYRRRFGW